MVGDGVQRGAGEGCGGIAATCEAQAGSSLEERQCPKPPHEPVSHLFPHSTVRKVLAPTHCPDRETEGCVCEKEGGREGMGEEGLRREGKGRETRRDKAWLVATPLTSPSSFSC